MAAKCATNLSSAGKINLKYSSWKIYSSYGLNTLGPLYLWKCFYMYIFLFQALLDFLNFLYIFFSCTNLAWFFWLQIWFVSHFAPDWTGGSPIPRKCNLINSLVSLFKKDKKAKRQNVKKTKTKKTKKRQKGKVGRQKGRANTVRAGQVGDVYCFSSRHRT